MAPAMPEDFFDRLVFCFNLASKFNFETEELPDYFIHRRLAAFIVASMGALDMPWLFTPNRITVLALCAGLYSAYLVSCFQHDENNLLYGGLWMLLSITLDCCDGQLARMYDSGSLVGRVADGVCDMFVAISQGTAWVYVMMYDLKLFDPIGGWSLLAVSAVLFQQQAMIFDRIKNVYCLKTAPVDKDKSNVVGLEEEAQVTKAIKQAWDEKKLIDYILLVWYKEQYLAVQNKVAKRTTDDVKKEIVMHPEEYRKKWKSTMRLVSWLGTGTHSFLFYILLFIAHFSKSPQILATWLLINNVGLTALWLVCLQRVNNM